MKKEKKLEKKCKDAVHYYGGLYCCKRKGYCEKIQNYDGFFFCSVELNKYKENKNAST